MFSLSFSARTGVLISDRKVTKATHLTDKLNLALAVQGGKTRNSFQKFTRLREHKTERSVYKNPFCSLFNVLARPTEKSFTLRNFC